MKINANVKPRHGPINRTVLRWGEGGGLGNAEHLSDVYPKAELGKECGVGSRDYVNGYEWRSRCVARLMREGGVGSAGGVGCGCGCCGTVHWMT